MGLLLRILWGRQSKWQFLFASVGFWIGLLIMLVAIQVFIDVRHIVKSKKANDETSYIILNKEVTLINAFNKGVSAFDSLQIDTIQKLPGVEAIGPFTANSFKITASMQSQLGFSAPIPFEAVPDEFLDTIPCVYDSSKGKCESLFVWRDEDNFVPVILSSELLRFYNMGVALTNQDMPQLPPSIVQMFPFDITISGNGKSRSLKARVVGYSDRIPAVLVPNAFMAYANATFGEANKPPGRIVLKVATSQMDQLGKEIRKRGYQINQEQLRFNNASEILQVVVSLAGGVGLLFLVLSFVIFLISFQLVISRAKNEINLLLDIGYTYSSVSRILAVQFAVIMGLVILTVFPVLYYIVRRIHLFLAEQQFSVVDKVSLVVIGAGVVAYIVVLVFNTLMLATSIKRK